MSKHARTDFDVLRGRRVQGMKPHDDSIFVVDIDIRSDGEDLRIQGDGAAYAGSGLPWLIQKRRRGDAATHSLSFELRRAVLIKVPLSFAFQDGEVMKW